MKSRPQHLISRFANFHLLAFFVAISLLLLTACGTNAPAGPTSTPTLTPIPPSPVPTLTSTPTSTPTITPTPRLPVIVGTIIPQTDSKLSIDNAEQIMGLARWGKGIITDVAYSPDGKQVAVASSLGISLRNAETLDEILYIETNYRVGSVAFSPDSKSLAGGINDKTAKIWSTEDGSLVQTFEGHKEVVGAVAFSHDGKMLSTGSADKKVRVWNISDASEVLEITSHSWDITGLAFSPDDQTLFSASLDGTIHQSQISDGKMVRAFGGHLLLDMALSADGSVIAAYDRTIAYAPGDLILWQVADGKKLQTIKGGQWSPDINSIALSADGQYVAAGWSDYSVKVWRVSNGALQQTLEDLKPEEENYYYGSFSVVFSPDSKTVLLAGRNVIGTWDVETGNPALTVKPFSEPIYGLSISPDGSSVAYVEGMNVYVRHVSDGSLIETPDKMLSVSDPAYSPDGSMLAVGLWEANVRVWPLAAGGNRQSFNMETQDGWVTSLTFSKDGSILAIGNAPHIEFRQVSDGTLVYAINTGIGHDIYDLRFSPDEKYIAMAAGDMVTLIRVEDEKMLKSLRGGECLAFSPDGAFIAGGGQDKLLQIWTVPDGKPVLTIKDQPDVPYSLAYSPDGTMLVAGYADGTISIWNPTDGTLVKTWKEHSATVDNIFFSPDGKYIISSSYDGTIRFWGLKP